MYPVGAGFAIDAADKRGQADKFDAPTFCQDVTGLLQLVSVTHRV